VTEYCYRWNQRRNEPGFVLSVEEARAKDAAGEEYTAILPPRPATTTPVLVTPVWQTGVVVVTFRDDFGRRTTEFTFLKRDEARMFLDSIHLWTYPNDDPRLRLGDAALLEVTRYRDDGYVKRVITNKDKGHRDTIEYSGVPVDINWEPVPPFGDYESIGRFERGAPPLDDYPSA
jgi:hypothetical protein